MKKKTKNKTIQTSALLLAVLSVGNTVSHASFGGNSNSSHDSSSSNPIVGEEITKPTQPSGGGLQPGATAPGFGGSSGGGGGIGIRPPDSNMPVLPPSSDGSGDEAPLSNSVVYVDPQSLGTGQGTKLSPYRDLQTALDRVATNGKIIIKGSLVMRGDEFTPLTIGKSVNIEGEGATLSLSGMPLVINNHANVSFKNINLSFLRDGTKLTTIKVINSNLTFLENVTGVVSEGQRNEIPNLELKNGSFTMGSSNITPFNFNKVVINNGSSDRKDFTMNATSKVNDLAILGGMGNNSTIELWKPVNITANDLTVSHENANIILHDAENSSINISKESDITLTFNKSRANDTISLNTLTASKVELYQGLDVRDKIDVKSIVSKRGIEYVDVPIKEDAIKLLVSNNIHFTFSGNLSDWNNAVDKRIVEGPLTTTELPSPINNEFSYNVTSDGVYLRKPSAENNKEFKNKLDDVVNYAEESLGVDNTEFEDLTFELMAETPHKKDFISTLKKLIEMKDPSYQPKAGDLTVLEDITNAIKRSFSSLSIKTAEEVRNDVLWSRIEKIENIKDLSSEDRERVNRIRQSTTASLWKSIYNKQLERYNSDTVFEKHNYLWNWLKDVYIKELDSIAAKYKTNNPDSIVVETKKDKLNKIVEKMTVGSAKEAALALFKDLQEDEIDDEKYKEIINKIEFIDFSYSTSLDEGIGIASNLWRHIFTDGGLKLLFDNKEAIKEGHLPLDTILPNVVFHGNIQEFPSNLSYSTFFEHFIGDTTYNDDGKVDFTDFQIGLDREEFRAIIEKIVNDIDIEKQDKEEYKRIVEDIKQYIVLRAVGNTIQLDSFNRQVFNILKGLEVDLPFDDVVTAGLAPDKDLDSYTIVKNNITDVAEEYSGKLHYFTFNIDNSNILFDYAVDGYTYILKDWNRRLNTLSSTEATELKNEINERFPSADYFRDGTAYTDYKEIEARVKEIEKKEAGNAKQRFKEKMDNAFMLFFTAGDIRTTISQENTNEFQRLANLANSNEENVDWNKALKDLEKNLEAIRKEIISNIKGENGISEIPLFLKDNQEWIEKRNAVIESVKDINENSLLDENLLNKLMEVINFNDSLARKSAEYNKGFIATDFDKILENAFFERSTSALAFSDRIIPNTEELEEELSRLEDWNKAHIEIADRIYNLRVEIYNNALRGLLDNNWFNDTNIEESYKELYNTIKDTLNNQEEKEKAKIDTLGRLTKISNKIKEFQYYYSILTTITETLYLEPEKENLLKKLKEDANNVIIGNVLNNLINSSTDYEALEEWERNIDTLANHNMANGSKELDALDNEDLKRNLMPQWELARNLNRYNANHQVVINILNRYLSLKKVKEDLKNDEDLKKTDGFENINNDINSIDPNDLNNGRTEEIINRAKDFIKKEKLKKLKELAAKDYKLDKVIQIFERALPASLKYIKDSQRIFLETVNNIKGLTDSATFEEVEAIEKTFNENYNILTEEIKKQTFWFVERFNNDLNNVLFLNEDNIREFKEKHQDNNDLEDTDKTFIKVFKMIFTNALFKNKGIEFAKFDKDLLNKIKVELDFIKENTPIWLLSDDKEEINYDNLIEIINKDAQAVESSLSALLDINNDKKAILEKKYEVVKNALLKILNGNKNEDFLYLFDSTDETYPDLSAEKYFDIVKEINREVYKEILLDKHREITPNDRNREELNNLLTEIEGINNKTPKEKLDEIKNRLSALDKEKEKNSIIDFLNRNKKVIETIEGFDNNSVEVKKNDIIQRINNITDETTKEDLLALKEEVENLLRDTFKDADGVNRRNSLKEQILEKIREKKESGVNDKRILLIEKMVNTTEEIEKKTQEDLEETLKVLDSLNGENRQILPDTGMSSLPILGSILGGLSLILSNKKKKKK